MKSLITTLESPKLRSGLAALVILLCGSHGSAGTSREPDLAASDQQPPAPFTGGETVVLKSPDVCLVERSVLKHKKDVPERLIPGRDRLFYKVELIPNADLRLMPSLNDVSGIPTEGMSLTIVAVVNSVFHFRVFNADGNVVVDTDEKTLSDQARKIADLRQQLERLWPPHELSGREKLRVIDAVTSVIGLKEPDRIRLVSIDDDRQGRLSPEQVVRAEDAVAYFTRQIATEPRDAGAYSMRARVWLERKDRKLAAADIDRAIEIEPKRAGLYVTRAMISIQDGQIDHALADCNSAIELDATESWAYVIRANIWLAKRDYPHAFADLNEIIRIDRANPLDWSVRFRYWLHVNDHDYARKDKNEGVRLDPNSSMTHLWRGDVWVADHDASRAIAEYTEAIRLDPASAFAYSRRATAWAMKHDRNKETSDLTLALQLEPKKALYRVARAESHSAQGRHELAMVDYNDALRLEPDNPSIWLARGNEWNRDLKLDEAIADYSRAIQLQPRYTPAYVARGYVWKRRRDFDKAIEEFSQLVRVEPQNALAHQTLARILATCDEAHFRNGKWAFDEAKQACELTNWRDPDCVDTFAAACAELGDYQSAVTWQRHAIALLAQDAPSVLQRSMNFGGRKGVQFEDRLIFYKSKKPTRE